MSAPESLLKNGVQNKQRYPTPLASHENVIKDPSLFWNTLRNFHSLMGTKYMVPVIGGKELNLHVLYGEVTKRGGYDKVVREKKWREVSSVFMFSATTTSASYALRKHYFSFLYHYEQLYFFNFQSPNSHNSPTPPDPFCFEATGTIDGKFDCGYLVSVKMGSETLNGVLYHPDQAPILPDETTESCTKIIPYNLNLPSSGQNNRRRRRRRRRRGRDDPNRPKPNRSGYNFFFSEKHSQLKSLYPEREREFTKMIGEAWNKLSNEERTVYQEQGVKDKERYQRELKEYKERIKIRQC